MKRALAAIAITVSLAALAAAAMYQYRQSAATDHHQSALQSKLHVVEQTLSATQQDLLGYTTFTQYLEVTKNITVTLKKPELVSSPAIGAISHEIPGKGLLIDEKEQVITLQQKLTIAAAKQGDAIKHEEAVIALCERKLGEFLRDFLAKQPNVRAVPMITFAYR